MDRFSVFFVVLIAVTVSSAEEEKLCYTQGEVAGIVIATFFVTLVVAALSVFAYRHFPKKRKGTERNEAEDSPTKKVLPELDSKYAFDNPYFRDDEVERPSPDDAEKGQAGVIADNGAIVQPNSTALQTNAAKNRKPRLSKNHPFSSVFHGVKKQRSRDDSYLAVEPERISVPLRGHDFTGLGFNICGNMRDGIFVKDVLHHGPASESGKIKAGDRILSVTISFNSMVYEDALTILSYASPYNVHLELEKATEKSQVVATASPGKRLGSVSFRSGGQRLFHPLYRSQSIDDLTQIGKEPSINQELAPKRSQSIGLSANQKPPRPHLRNADSLPEETDRPMAILTSTGSLDERSLPVVSEDPIQQASSPVILEDAEEPKYEGLQLPRNKDENTDSNENDYATPEDIRVDLTPVNDPPKLDSDKEEEKPPLPYPRKGGTPGKRKAPAPPKPYKTNSSETTAQVHQVESSDTDMSILVSAEDAIKLNDSLDRGILQLKDPDEVDSLEPGSPREATSQREGSQSDVSNDSLEVIAPEEHKRKSSSLGDLTKLDDVASKKSPTVLERAVSLDLKQESIPDSNLVLQKKILKPPDFDEGDSTETDLSVEQEGSKESHLKKWNHNENEAVSKFSNGDALESEGKKNNVDFETASEPSTSSNSPTLSTASSIADDTKTLTSTPLKKVIQADSSLTMDITQNPHQKNGGADNKSISFLAKNSEGTPVSVEIPVIPPVIRQLERRDHPSTPVQLQPYQATNLSQQKEVIEISEKELDNIMMSHKQFLLKQAKVTGVYSTLNPDPKTDPEIEFESWSYDEENQNAKVNGNGSSTPSSHYNTALDITPPLLSDADSAPLWKQAEVNKYDDAPLWKQADLPREYTVRTSEGGITKTVLITSSGDTLPTDSEPPQLQPPYN